MPSSCIFFIPKFKSITAFLPRCIHYFWTMSVVQTSKHNFIILPLTRNIAETDRPSLCSLSTPPTVVRFVELSVNWRALVFNKAVKSGWYEAYCRCGSLTLACLPVLLRVCLYQPWDISKGLLWNLREKAGQLKREERNLREQVCRRRLSRLLKQWHFFPLSEASRQVYLLQYCMHSYICTTTPPPKKNDKIMISMIR